MNEEIRVYMSCLNSRTRVQSVKLFKAWGLEQEQISCFLRTEVKILTAIEKGKLFQL